jgi:hypothetical protein
MVALLVSEDAKFLFFCYSNQCLRVLEHKEGRAGDTRYDYHRSQPCPNVI